MRSILEGRLVVVWLLVRSLLAAVAGLPGQAVHAQEARVITMEEAYASPSSRTDIQRACSSVELNAIRATQERLDFVPDLQLSSVGTRSFGRSFSPEEGAIINETSDFFGADTSASVDLFNGFEKFASLERADLEVTASRRRLARTREYVVYLVPERYAAMLQNPQFARVREQEHDVQRDFLIAVLMALALVYMVLAGQFERFLDPLVVMFSVPVALVGVIPTLLLTGTTLNVQSVMGLVMLIGIVVNNAIVLVDTLVLPALYVSGTLVAECVHSVVQASSPLRIDVFGCKCSRMGA